MTRAVGRSTRSLIDQGLTAGFAALDHGPMQLRILMGALAIGGAGLVGCGGKVIFDDGSGGAGINPGPTSAVGGTTHAAVTSTGTGPSGQLDISLGNLQFFTDCKPRVGSDPIGGSFDVTFHNTGSSTFSAAVNNPVKLTINGGTLVWSFAIDTAGPLSIPAGGTTTATFKKVDLSGSGQPPGLNPCDVCGQQATLTVTFSDGETKSADLPFGLPCAF